ncbi:MAG: hypothetical protein IT373_20680 [Polyangiaceae bacterium]|nr:hypothetical protein [Polyangiaceae bacterium]
MPPLRHARVAPLRRAVAGATPLLASLVLCLGCSRRADAPPAGAGDGADPVATCTAACRRTGACGLELVDLALRELPAGARAAERGRAEAAVAQDEQACQAACEKRLEDAAEASDDHGMARCLAASDCSTFLACLASELG